MTRICSQLTNSKLPLQGQKNVEVKEEKNDEKNLYRDISTHNFRVDGNFVKSFFERSMFSTNQASRKLYFSDARSSPTTVQSGANNRQRNS